MKLLNADFVTSAARADGIPRDELPRIALAGRSNVGKSSLINALCRAKIARTSAEPGKTRLVNFYRVLVEGGPGGPGRWGLYLVDLPGYGYARGGSDSAAELARVAQTYFGARGSSLGARETPGVLSSASGSRIPSPEPRHVALLLVDSRHPELAADRNAARWLDDMNVLYHVVATKIDKLSRSERTRNLKTLETLYDMPALPVSAVSGEGLDELWRTIARLVRTAA